VPAWHRGWTDDIFPRSLRAGRALQKALVRSTCAADRGVVQRGDLTGFNWANVPVVLVETGFLTNPAESRRLKTGAYQQRVALGIARGVAAVVSR
jgi:N-acetylmuramoyl-L-alanine amidase